MSTQVEEARDFVRSMRGRYPDICAEADLDYSWLCKFGQGKMREPGALKVERILRYRDRLSAQALPKPEEAAA